MQLDTDPNFIDNIQMASAATAEEGAGLTPLEGAALRVKDDIPIDLRVKLIVSMIHLGVIPNEVNWLYECDHIIYMCDHMTHSFRRQYGCMVYSSVQTIANHGANRY